MEIRIALAKFCFWKLLIIDVIWENIRDEFRNPSRLGIPMLDFILKKVSFELLRLFNFFLSLKVFDKLYM